MTIAYLLPENLPFYLLCINFAAEYEYNCLSVANIRSRA